MDTGLDFADALHLTQAWHCEAFITFDKGFARAARGLDGIVVVKTPAGEVGGT